jgi:hypothetical protein
MGKETKVETPQTIEEALSLIKGLTEKNTNQEATIMEQAELIDELSAKVEKLETKVASGISYPTVTIKNKTYRVMVGVRHAGKNFTPSELAENAELCKEFLKIDGQNILVEEE